MIADAAPTNGHRSGSAGASLVRAGEAIAFIGVLAPLILIGVAKFTAPEIEALRPVIGGTPWLAWLYPALGEAGASYLLGTVELATAVLLLLSLRWRLAGMIGGALATLTFLTTCSLMLVLPIWDPAVGFPVPGPMGQFLIKDITLLGVALVLTGRSLGADPSPSSAANLRD